MLVSYGLCTLLLLLSVDSVVPQEGVVIYITGETNVIGCPNDSSTNTKKTLVTKEKPESPTNTKKTLVMKEKPVECPESEGFYSPSGSNQCFRLFKRFISWDAAKEKCASEGMVLAKPKDDFVEQLIEDFRGLFNVWLGARGSGSSLVWIKDNSVLSNNSPLWDDDEPASHLSEDHCLLLWAGWRRAQPYYSKPCSNDDAYTLCQVISA